MILKFSGNIIFILEFRKICGFSGILFFTGKAAAAHGICCFCFLRKQAHGGRNAFCGSDPIPVKMKIGNIRRCSRFSHYQYNFR